MGKHRIDERVLRDDRFADDFRRALTAPLHAASYGARVNSPRLTMLVKNIDRTANHFAENAVMLSLASLSLRGLDEARRPWLMIDAMLRARMPAPDHSLDELQQVETVLESELNPLQVQYIMGDRSHAVKLSLLERFRRYRVVLDQIIEKLERDLFGAAK